MSEFVEIAAIIAFTIIVVVIACILHLRNRPEKHPQKHPKKNPINLRVVGAFCEGKSNVKVENVSAMYSPSKEMVGEYIGLHAKDEVNVNMGSVIAGGAAQSSPGRGEELSWKDNYLKRELSTPYELQGPCGALIICNLFDDESKKNKNGWPKKREGAEWDRKGLKELFDESLRSKFAFVDDIKNVDGKVRNNLMPDTELEKKLEKFRQKLIDRKCGSFILAVSSHGGRKSNSILMNDRTEKNFYRDFVYQFSHERFQEFKGKPKIFLVQACQDYTDTELPSVDSTVGSEDTIQDVLVAFATTPYQVALRSKEKGSVFIQSVVETFTEHALKNNLREMLLEVYRDVCQMTDGVKNQIMQTVLVSDIGFKSFEF